MSDAYCDVLWDRLVFQPGDPRLKSEKRTQWTPAEITLVKQRSAFFKQLILFLQDDPKRPGEIIRFQSRSRRNSDNDASVDDFTTLPRFTTTDDTEHKFLADEFRPFLNKVLISREPLEKNQKFLWWVCKCAWMCKCPPEGFQCPSEVLAPSWSLLGGSHYFTRGNRKVVARKPAETSDITSSFATRPWNSPRECTCRDDTCTCSLEFATICLWLGWKLYFKKHLRAAIWATYVGSLDLETPVKKLRNLREARTEARQHLLGDLQQYLKDHSKQWNALVEKETREKLEKYLKNTQEVLPGSLGRALEEKLACRDETNGTPPSPSSPKCARQAMKHDRRKSVNTTHTSGATSQNSEGSSGSGAAVGAGLVNRRVKDAYDVGLTEWTDELWDKLEKKTMARQDENNSFVRQMLEDLTARVDQRQDKLAEDIWSWRLKEMEHWKWVLGIPEVQESSYRTASYTED